MSAIAEGSQSHQTNLLGLVGLPLHFSNRPTSWPWDVEVVCLPALHQRLNMRQVTSEEVLHLLIDLSDAGLKAGLKDEEDMPPVLKLTEKETKVRLRFAQRLEELAPRERLSCCGHSKEKVQLVEGRPLLLDPWHEGDLLFGDDPIAWIRNGLHAIDRRVLRSLPPMVPVSDFLPCPALTIQPCELPDGRKITTPTIPALYIGLRPVNQVIDEWRANFWFQDIRDGYARAGERLQERRLQRVPSTSVSDPVYRFIDDPSERLRDEALTFLRHAHDKPKERTGADGDKGAKTAHANCGAKPTRGSWAHTTPPPVEQNWWQPPLIGSLTDLAKAIGVSQSVIKIKNQNESLWVLPVHTKKYQVWFRTQYDYNQARSKMPDERKNP